MYQRLRTSVIGSDAIWNNWRSCLLIAILFGVAFIVRSRHFGNPELHVDESFYLYVGDRMLHGAIPYVHIWDRKPIGLFLLYAAIRMLGGEGIVQYQIFATLFAGSTAALIAMWTRPAAGTIAALAAGGCYLAWADRLGGMGGQAPIFYNLLILIAAYQTWRGLVAEPIPNTRKILMSGAATMLILGIAIQMKYTVVVEGMFFGLVLLWQLYRAGASPLAFLATGLLWIFIALLPTMTAFIWYAAHGYGQQFIFTNFQSIWLRPMNPPGVVAQRFRDIAVFLAVPMVLACIRILSNWRSQSRYDALSARFLAGWLIAASAAVLMIGVLYGHYALPLLPPLFVTLAPMMRPKRLGYFALTAMLVLGIRSLLISDARRSQYTGTGWEIRPLANFIRPRLNGECLYVFSGPMALYTLTHSCAPTAYIFPPHLSTKGEAQALGIDPGQELRRILSLHPPVIVSYDTSLDAYAPNWALIRQTTAKDYSLVGLQRLGVANVYIYERADLARRRQDKSIDEPLPRFRRSPESGIINPYAAR